MMTLSDFQDKVFDLSNNYGNDEIPSYIYPTIGLAGETGEVMEEVKKSLRKGPVIDPERRENIRLELGDVMFYVAMLAESLDLNLDDIANALFEKLDKRFKRKRVANFQNPLHEANELAKESLKILLRTTKHENS